MEKRLLNVKEIAEFLGVSERTVWSWVYTGEIPYIRVRRTVRFDPERVVAALERQNPKTPEIRVGVSK